MRRLLWRPLRRLSDVARRASPPPAVADLARVPEMGSGQLRRLAQAAAQEGGSEELWAALARRCEATAVSLNHWDAVHILQSFTEATVENRSLFLSLGDALSFKTSKMAVKHILDLLAVYEAKDLRPQTLYVELLHALVRLSRSMYAEELALILQALARYELGNPTVVAQLMRSMASEIKEFRLRYLCAATGALGALSACAPELMEILDRRARFEVDTVNLQELQDNMQAFPLLEFSWQPYEEMCEAEFLHRMALLRTAEDVDQLVDPFASLLFLRSRGRLTADYLKALCQWCLRGVHRPNVRSERRPSSKQLLLLHDLCFEFGLEQEPALQDAVGYFVESAGGQWPERHGAPLQYHKKRRYIRTEDPLEGRELPKWHVKEPESSETGELSIFGDAPEVQVPSAPAGRKVSGPSPLLAPEDTLAYRLRARSRRGVRPRPPRDALRKRDFNKEETVGPLWYYGGWAMRPKYQPGRWIGRHYPWPKGPVGPRGAAWILRR